jgi:hypothetical protein
MPHSVVHDAYKRLQKKKAEEIRFESLIKSLAQQYSVEYLISCMALINSIVNMPEDLETRLKMRHFFIQLGIVDLITVSPIIFLISGCLLISHYY